VALVIGGNDVIVDSWWPDCGELNFTAGVSPTFEVRGCVCVCVLAVDRLLHMSQQLNSS